MEVITQNVSGIHKILRRPKTDLFALRLCHQLPLLGRQNQTALQKIQYIKI